MSVGWSKTYAYLDHAHWKDNEQKNSVGRYTMDKQIDAQGTDPSLLVLFLSINIYYNWLVTYKQMTELFK